MLYPKINSIYKRDPATNFKTFLPEYSEPEFELLADLPWEATEKIDGTNIRIIWDGDTVTFGGRTDNAQIPAKLVTHLQETFTPNKFLSLNGSGDMILFGEGYGAGIQSAGGNYSKDQRFILFDVAVGDWWLRWEDMQDVANTMSIPLVHRFDDMNLLSAVYAVRTGLESVLGTGVAEGLVLRAPLGLKNRAGRRLITKVKASDFQGQ